MSGLQLFVIQFIKSMLRPKKVYTSYYACFFIFAKSTMRIKNRNVYL